MAATFTSIVVVAPCGACKRLNPEIIGDDNCAVVKTPDTFKPSVSTVPSKNAFLHYFDAEPIS